jgi:hypothetical protein
MTRPPVERQRPAPGGCARQLHHGYSYVASYFARARDEFSTRTSRIRSGGRHGLQGRLELRHQRSRRVLRSRRRGRESDEAGCQGDEGTGQDFRASRATCGAGGHLWRWLDEQRRTRRLLKAWWSKSRGDDPVRRRAADRSNARATICTRSAECAHDFDSYAVIPNTDCVRACSHVSGSGCGSSGNAAGASCDGAHNGGRADDEPKQRQRSHRGNRAVPRRHLFARLHSSGRVFASSGRRKVVVIR